MANENVYVPSDHAVTAKPLGISSASPTDARSYIYDKALFKRRPYRSVQEVLETLTSTASRSGHFPIFINEGGVLNFSTGVFTGGTINRYWFRDGTLDANLVLDNAGGDGDYATEAFVQGELNGAVAALKGGVPAEGDTLAKIWSLVQALNTMVTGNTPDGDAFVDTIMELMAVFATYPEGTDMMNLLAQKVAKSEIVNNLIETTSGKVLDARQGKTLSDMINATNSQLNSKQPMLGYTPLQQADLATYAKLADVTNAVNTSQNAIKGGVVEDGDTLAKLYAKVQAVSAVVTSTAPDGDAIVNTLSEILTVFSTYPEGVNLITTLTQKVNTTDVVNTVSETQSGKVLDARVGKTLQDQISTMNTTIANSSVANYTQTSHPFIVGDLPLAVRLDANNNWIRARSNTEANANAVAIVVGIVDANTIKLVRSGSRFDATGMGLGQVKNYWLTDTDTGRNITDVEPVSVGKIRKHLFSTGAANVAEVNIGETITIVTIPTPLTQEEFNVFMENYMKARTGWSNDPAKYFNGAFQFSTPAGGGGGTTTLGNTSLTATATGHTSIKLDWATVASATGYLLQMASDAGFTTNVQTVYTGAALTHTVTGLTPTTQYFFRVAATATGFNNSNYATANATTSAAPVVTGSAFRQASAGAISTVSGETMTVPMPITNVQANDIYIALLYVRDTVTVPSIEGWTQYSYYPTNVGSSGRMYVLYKHAVVGSDPATITPTWSGVTAAVRMGRVYRFGNVPTDTPLLNNKIFVSSSGTGFTEPLTVSNTGSILVNLTAARATAEGIVMSGGTVTWERPVASLISTHDSEGGLLDMFHTGSLDAGQYSSGNGGYSGAHKGLFAFELRQINGAGGGTPVLAVPVVTLSGVGQTAITVGWTAPVNATSYQLERATDAAFTQNLVTRYTGNANSFADSGLAQGTTYYYRVKAVASGYTDSAYGTASATTTSSVTQLGTPSVSSTTIDHDSIKVDLVAVPNATSYIIERATDAGFTANLVQVYNGSALSYTNDGLLASTTYYYRAKAQASGYADSNYGSSSSTTATLASSSQPSFMEAGTGVQVADLAADLVIPIPLTGAQSGDLLFAQVGVGDTTTVPTLTGWTIFEPYPCNIGSSGRVYMAYKYVGANEPSSVTPVWSTATAAARFARVYRFRGTTATSPLANHQLRVSSSLPMGHANPITPTTPKSIFVYAVATRGTLNFATVSGGEIDNWLEPVPEYNANSGSYGGTLALQLTPNAVAVQTYTNVGTSAQAPATNHMSCSLFEIKGA